MTAARSFTTLFRLYDLPAWSQTFARANELGVELGPLAYRDVAGATRLLEGHAALSPALVLPILLARTPSPAVVARRAGEIVGLGISDLRSPGTVGPVIHTDDALGRALGPILLEHTLHAAAWRGYHYLVDADLTPALHDPLRERACMSLADLDPRASPAERDVAGMPWGDVYIPTTAALASSMPPVFPYRNGEDGRLVRVRQAVASEYDLVTGWVSEAFGRGWASELKRGFTREPIATLLAVLEDDTLAPVDRLLGFIAYDCAGLSMGSTIAVHPKVGAWRHRLPIATALVVHEVREQMARGFEYLIGSGISRRQTILAIGGWTVPGSYPGPFANVINYK